MRRIKVLHITECLAGGVLVVLQNVLNRIDKEKYEIVIAYSTRPETPTDLVRCFDSHIRLIHVPMTREISPAADLKAVLCLRKIVRREQPDVIHLHSSKAGALGRIVVSTLTNRPKVLYSPHGYSFLRKDVSNSKRMAYWLIEKTLAYLPGTTIACSTGEFYEARKLTRDCVLSPNAVPVQEILQCVSGDQMSMQKTFPGVTVAMLGRICAQRRPDIFNKVAEKVCLQAQVPVRFVWIGDGPDRALLGNSVEVTGWKKHEEALRFLAHQVDIYLHTSEWEGMPMALLEAMALGKPAVATNCVGNEDIIEHGVSGYLGNSVEELATYTLELVNNNSLRIAVGASAARRVRNVYSIEKQVEAWSKLYELGDRE